MALNFKNGFLTTQPNIWPNNIKQFDGCKKLKS